MPQVPLVSTCSNLFTPGRACPVTAVVLHEWNGGIENLSHEMCRCLRPRPLTSPGCHTSYHYGIAGNCNFQQYIPPTDTAWGFYFIPTPACPIPPCPIVQTCDGLGADQYNPQEDGTLATPIVTAGPDGSANCSVIHVAVASGIRTGSGIYCINSHEFSPNAYKCLVQSLCYIFDAAGITPTGYSTLLTHVGELYDLDLIQLALDIQTCLDFVPPPPPPCECTPILPPETPIVPVDTATIDMVAAGTAGHSISANVRISATAGNQVTANADGLFVAADTEVPITVNDSASIDLTASGTDNHTLTASLIIDNTLLNNKLVINPDGAYVEPLDFDELCAAIQTVPSGGNLQFGQSVITDECDASTYVNPVAVTDTTTVNLTATVGTEVTTIDAAVIVDPAAGNILSANAGGLRAQLPVAGACAATPVTNLNGFQFLGTAPAGGSPTYFKFADPLLIVSTDTLDVLASLTLGKRIFMVLNESGTNTLELTNHPDGTCDYKEIWIKNRGDDPLVISAAGALIDGNATFTLPARIVLGAGGDALHLVWFSLIDEWIILSNYDNNNA